MRYNVNFLHIKKSITKKYFSNKFKSISNNYFAKITTMLLCAILIPLDRL